MNVRKSILTFLYPLLLTSLCLCTTIGCRYKVPQFKDKNATGGELRTPLQSIFAHLNQKFYLTVNTKTFTDVRGTPPFYLEVPQLRSLLFVTGKMDTPATFHVYNLATKQDTTIQGGPVAFGWEVGGKTPTNLYTVYVQAAATNRIKLAWNRDDSKQNVILNLDSKTVQVEDLENPPPATNSATAKKGRELPNRGGGAVGSGK